MPKKYTARRQGKSVQSAEALEGRRLFANDYTVGVDPSGVVAADFNGDGKIDLAVVNGTSSTVSVLTGLGDGRFSEPMAVSVGTNANAIVTGDYNADGRADLITANGYGGPGGYSVLLNNGDATFAVNTVPLTGSPTHIVTADFNNDGKADFALANVVGGTVSVFTGAGNGGFNAPTNVPTGMTAAASLAVGDVDADGDADLAATNNDLSAGRVSVLRNNGNGTFAAASLTTTASQPNNLIARDVNADGRADLLLTVSPSPRVSVLLATASGTFAAAAGVALNPSLFEAADVNADGKVDLVDNTGSVALGNGNGTFAAPYLAVGGVVGNSLVVADFNADGRPDLATTRIVPTGNGTVFVRLGTGDGQFADNVLAAPAAFTGPAKPDEGVSGDFDNDGVLDFAVLNNAGGNAGNVTVYRGSGTGTFSQLSVRSVGNFPQGLTAGDFNSDGYADLATANNGGAGTVSVLINNGDGTFAPQISLAAGFDVYDIASGDFNGDGKLDLAVCINASTGSVRRWLGNGDGTFGAASDTLTNASNPIDLAVADVNNDGRADLATANDSSSGPSVSVLLGTIAGGFAVIDGPVLGGNAKAVAFGDFGGSNALDLAVGTNGNGGRYHVLIGNGAGNFPFSPAQAEVGATPQKIAAGDFNNDGKLDLVSGDDFNVRVLLGNGAGGVASFPAIPATGAFAVTPGDFNGDGRLDVIADRFSNATVSVLLNQAPSALSPLATVSNGVLSVPAASTAGLREVNGILGIISPGGSTGQYVNASGVKSVVISGTAAGPFVIYNDLGRSGGMRNVSLATPTGQSLSVSNQHLGTLIVPATGTFRMTAAAGLLRVNTLNLGGGSTLDLGTNDFIYDYSGPTPINTVRGLLASARGTGTWTGAGLTSKNAANDPGKSTGLGFMEASAYKTLNGATATFAGESLDSTAVVVRYTYYGDTDLDRGVSINDFNRLATNFGVASNRLWFDGDFDYDGGVSINDFNLLAANFGKTLAAPAPAPAASASAKTGVAPAKAKR